MSLKLKNLKGIQSELIKRSSYIELALQYSLEYLVEKMINHAKASAGYQDQTANLKSSIGGYVLKDGRRIGYRGFVQEPSTIGTFEGVGTLTGTAFIDSLVSKYQSGYVILLVAGMEYATYVENFHNLNVLKKSELQMQIELPSIMKDLQDEIKLMP